MVYWADVLYAEPSEGELESAGEDLAGTTVAPGWDDALESTEDAWVSSLADKLDTGADPGVDAPESPAAEPGLERVVLPDLLLRPLMRTLLRDVHHYLFNARHVPRPDDEYEVQEEIRRRTVEALEEGASEPGPHIVISHSMGTVIAYDCLKRVADCPPVDALLTVGSPLGLDEIPDRMRPEWTRIDGYPTERLRGDWVNVFDHFDPVVGPTPHLGFRYKDQGAERVMDLNEQNWGRWRHDITKYLHGPQLRKELERLLG
jgi:predicted alpha/beta hydrolase family esterase